MKRIQGWDKAGDEKSGILSRGPDSGFRLPLFSHVHAYAVDVKSTVGDVIRNADLQESEC